MSRYKHSSVSMEEITEDLTGVPFHEHPDTEPQEPVASLDTSETPESLMLQANAANDEVEIIENDIQEDSVAVEQLSSYLHAMESLESLDAVSAKLMYIGLETNKALKNHSLVLPSLESYNDYSALRATEISQEGIMDSLTKINDKLQEKIVLMFKKGVALAQSMTPVLNSLKERANTLSNKIDASRREAGMKEVSGNFAFTLSVQGISGSSKTVMETSKKLLEITHEILDPSVYKTIANAAIHGAEAVKNSNPKNYQDLKIGNWQLLLYFVLIIAAQSKDANGNTDAVGGAGAIGAGAQAGGHEYITRKKIKPNRALFPDMFKMFPKASKHKLTGKWLFKNLDYRGSDHLFDLRYIVVCDYNENLSGANIDWGYPHIDLSRDKLTHKGRNNKLPTLTSKEQKELVDIASQLIDINLEFWKGYQKRLDELKRVIQTVNSMMQEYERKVRDETTLATTVFRSVMFDLPRYYYQMMFDGCVNGQKKLARYNTGIIKAQLEYVAVSMNATQND